MGNTLPRGFSPCGLVLSRNSVQLMREPADYYGYVASIDPPCHEVLLVPFGMAARPIGTIWVVMHEPNRHFDGEDARLLTSLAEFASAGYQSLTAIEALEENARQRSAEVRSLSDAHKLKDEFIATIAHELRGPLGPIRNTSAILKLGSREPAVLAKASEVLERQSSVMTRLIEDLLDVSRVRLGVLELHPTRLNLAEILQAALEGSNLAPGAASHSVDMQLGEQPVWLEADPMRLTQVFNNLFNNAAKYTDPGGAVSVRLMHEETNAVVSIADTGIGIPAEKMESIFDLFAQAGQAGTARSSGGLGIGLHLAKKLVEAHHGQLTAKSEGSNRGSTFYVRLPV
jgi:signal transduction histidine kinase